MSEEKRSRRSSDAAKKQFAEQCVGKRKERLTEQVYKPCYEEHGWAGLKKKYPREALRVLEERYPHEPNVQY